MNGGIARARVDQGLELAEHLAAAHLDRADLGDRRAAPAEPPVVSRSTTHERHVAQRAAELVEARLTLRGRTPSLAVLPARAVPWLGR